MVYVSDEWIEIGCLSKRDRCYVLPLSESLRQAQ